MQLRLRRRPSLSAAPPISPEHRYHPNTRHTVSRGRCAGCRECGGRARRISTRPHRPPRDRGATGPASAHSTDFPCEVWCMRETRIRSGGATEGSDDARTECLSHAPDLVRQTPAVCTRAHSPSTVMRTARARSCAQPKYGHAHSPSTVKQPKHGQLIPRSPLSSSSSAPIGRVTR